MTSRGRGPVGRLASLALAAGLLACGAEVALAHDQAVLRSARSAAVAGERLELTGEDFTAGVTYDLELRGPLASYELGEIEPDSAGRVEGVVGLPAGTRPGRYRLVALAPDGDQVASLQLTVEAGPAAPSDGATPAEGAGARAAAETPEARPGEMPIRRDRSGVEWFLAGLFVGGTAGGGLFLLRRQEPGAGAR